MRTSLMGCARKLKAATERLLYPIIFWGRARHCPICSANVRRFQPIGRIHLQQAATWGFPWDLRRFETLNLDEYYCPVCHEPDRARLMALWVSAWVAKRPAAASWRLLDFAPSRGLQRYLRALPKIIYRSADKYMADVDDHIDITNMPYEDGSFDAFICSHVLEHIPDEQRALQELLRILKPGGWGLLLVPISLDALETEEETDDEAKAATEASRWRRFGQGDHIRLYARNDFLRRIREAGFACSTFDAATAGPGVFTRTGITSSSVLYVVERPDSGRSLQ